MTRERRRPSGSQRRSLERLAADPTTLPRLALRARIVLVSAEGLSDRQVAARLGSTPPTVALWRRRYAQDGIAGLRDHSRSGRPSAVADLGRETISDNTRETLLEAASRMIVKRGFASTRISDIAGQVGISPAAVHYYFKTKEEILVQALLWTNERLVSWLEATNGGPGDPIDRLATFLERTVPYPGERRDEYLLEIDLWSWIRLRPDTLPTYEAYSDLWIAHVSEIIQHGVDAGAFTITATAADVAERIVALTDGLAVQSAIGATRMPPERTRALVLDFVAEQLSLSPATLKRRSIAARRHKHARVRDER